MTPITIIDALVQAVEKESGVDLIDLVSRRRGEGLRRARGILVLLAKEIGYTLTELQRILKRDVSVLSCLAAISETTEGQKLLRKIRMGLNAQQQA